MEHLLEADAGILEFGLVVWRASFEHHVELEDFFEQLRRNVLRALLADVETFELEQVFGALDRIAQNPIAVVQG